MLIQKGLGDPLNTPLPPLLATKHDSVAIVYISYKNFRCSLDKSAAKIDRRILFPSTHVTAWDFLVFVLSSFVFVFVFILETLHEDLPVIYAKSRKKTTSCKKPTESPGWTSSSANQRYGIRTLQELVIIT